jgi:hypothetical protein
MTTERCAVCGCRLSRTKGEYAKPTIEGRSHATKHHFVAERFFGRSANRPGEQRERIFKRCPWGVEGESAVFCYECHEELLHNPVFLSRDIEGFAELVRRRGLNEKEKTKSRDKLARRIELLHEVLEQGIQELLSETRRDA